jgi:hypothetical protein
VQHSLTSHVSSCVLKCAPSSWRVCLYRAAQTYLAAVSASDTFITERKPEMTHSLDLSIMKLNEQLSSVSTALNEGVFVDAAADPALVLEQVLCCAVLCCAVLCCAVLCCAVLCCAVLCCAVLCCAVLCCAVVDVWSVLCGSWSC